VTVDIFFIVVSPSGVGPMCGKCFVSVLKLGIVFDSS
jgi:hypothetical protein